MEAMWQALNELLTIQQIVFLATGILVGLIVGVLPGMGGLAGMALLLPFVYGLAPVSALALMIGMLASTASGDAFASILMGIPGGSSSATILDGFPLTRQGHAARALSAAFTACMLGGVFGVVLLTASVFVARPLILGIGMGEQLLLILFALTMVGSLAGSSPMKGLAAAGIGLLLGSMGAAPATGEPRFAFGLVYLNDGLPLVVMALGIFALPEIFDLMRTRAAISQTPQLGSGRVQGIVDAFANWWLVLRVSVIGGIIGILPGVGASTADWVAYGHAVQTSRDRSRFGKGDIRGVIASEAPNNATRGGDLIPTLFFGIPGSGSMALLLGGFLLVGVRPGPNMVAENLDLTFVIIWSLVLGNLISAVLCLALIGPIAKLTLVRYAFLGPLILVFVVFTAFQATKNWGDLLALVALGIVGLLMKRFEWSRPALIVGFVLSENLEASVYQTAQVYGFSFLARPQAAGIAVLVAVSLTAGIWFMIRSRHHTAAEEAKAPRRRWPQIAFTLACVLLVVYALIEATGMSYLSRMYPLWVGGLSLVFLLGVIIQQVFADPADAALTDHEAASEHEVGILIYFGCFVGFLLLVGIIGFPLAALIFVTAFITVECGRPYWRNATIGLATVAFLIVFSSTLYMEYPQGVLADVIHLPDWLR
jgi:TctA family transporter